MAKDKIEHLAKDADVSGHTSPEVVRLLAEIDLLNMALPEKYGGIDADYTTSAAAIRSDEGLSSGTDDAGCKNDTDLCR